MSGRFGGNLLAPYVNRAHVEQHLARLQPSTLLVMGDGSDPTPHHWARDLKQKYPACTVIYRQHNAQDQNWDGTSAAALWDIHRPYAVDGLVVQVWNEPNGYQPLDSLISRAVLLCQYARQEGRRVGVPAWGVGHPADERVDAGELDPLLRALAADQRDAPNLYLVHEYGQASTKDEPYHVGRFRRTVERSLAIGAPLDYRRIAVTEYGRDYQGNASKDGWRVYFNNDEQAFFDFLLPGIELYQQLGVLGAAVYCCGWTWASFDYQNAETLKRSLEAWNQAHPIEEGEPMPPTPPSGDPAAYTVAAAAGLYLRPAPNTSASLRRMPYREAVTGYPATQVRAGAYDWIVVRDALGNTGWAARIYLQAASAPAPALRLRNPIGCAHVISARFGVPRDYDGDGVFDDLHEGLDITRAHGDCTPLILNGADGVVMEVSSAGAYGNHVVVSTVVGGQEYRVWYCHLAQLFVAKGQAVKAGAPLGVMGSSGNSTGLHLHLSVQKVGAPTPAGSPLTSVIDPEPMLEW